MKQIEKEKDVTIVIQVDVSNVWGALSLPDLLNVEKEVADAHAMLAEGTGSGAELRGWMRLPAEQNADEISRILDAAEKIRSDSEVCVVVGTGGSERGSRAAMELLQGRDRNLTRTPRIFFAGDTFSTRRWKELMQLLEGRDFSVIVISESGTTLEPAIALRNLRWMLERKYGTDEASNRIYAITDPDQGALAQMAREEQWQTFSIPAGVSGRFSALSPAGLLPMAVAGIDIQEMLRGAAAVQEEYNLRSFENPVWLYAGVRNALYRRGMAVELLESFEPGFRAFGLWWQQLFAASEGKNGKGIFPAAAELPTDLYALGQLAQEGSRNLFETVVRFAPEETGVAIDSDWKNLDGLGYLEGKNLDFVEEMAFQGMVSAHADEGVPVLVMDCGPLNEGTVGELFYFLELSCAVSAYTLGVNPFSQPGVEACLQNIEDLLGKPEA